MLTKIQRGQAYQAPCVLLLGGFDGLHAGHMTLLEAAKQFRCPVGLTSISGGKAGGDIFPFVEREYIYEQAGLDFVYEILFSEELKNTSAEAFAKELFQNFLLKALICGSDFRFGKDALGTPEYLKRIAPCPVLTVQLKLIGGEKVSSSHVKKLLSEGSMSEVNTYLSYPYFSQGKVEHGRGVGHTIGFPTLNLSYPKIKFPLREGVYGGYTQTERGTYPSIINMGARPTFGVTEQKLEAYLDGFEGDLYGSTVRVFPTEFYRPIQKFASVDGLKTQLEQDKERLHRVL